GKQLGRGNRIVFLGQGWRGHRGCGENCQESKGEFHGAGCRKCLESIEASGLMEKACRRRPLALLPPFLPAKDRLQCCVIPACSPSFAARSCWRLGENRGTPGDSQVQRGLLLAMQALCRRLLKRRSIFPRLSRSCGRIAFPAT